MLSFIQFVCDFDSLNPRKITNELKKQGVDFKELNNKIISYLSDINQDFH